MLPPAAGAKRTLDLPYLLPASRVSAIGIVVPTGGVPDLHGVVAAARGETLAVGAEREAHHQPGVPAQRVLEPPRRGVPNSDGGVGAGGGEPAAVAAEGEREHV